AGDRRPSTERVGQLVRGRPVDVDVVHDDKPDSFGRRPVRYSTARTITPTPSHTRPSALACSLALINTYNRMPKPRTGTTTCRSQSRLPPGTTWCQNTDTCRARNAVIAPKFTSVDSSAIPSSRELM